MAATCPVCKMQVDEATTGHKGQHAGTPYFFCSAACVEAFEKDPHKYLADHPH